MSKRASDGGKNGDKKKQEVSPAARRKQIIVGLVMGLIGGLGISYFATFWYWLPAGLAFGLAVGAIMKPPPSQ